jgi:hypothetical protein
MQMELTNIRSRLRTAGRVALVGAASMGLILAAGASAGATPTPAPNHCVIVHELYQQPVAAIIADASGETCPSPSHPEGRQVELKVYRNGDLVADISGGIAPNYRYDCITTADTVWSTNWDPPKSFPCG